jgi:hypothetical protein
MSQNFSLPFIVTVILGMLYEQWHRMASTDLKNNFDHSPASKFNSSVVTGVQQLVSCNAINKCFFMTVPT